MVRFGIMGAGGIARKFADAARRVEGVQVLAVASKSRERAAAFAREQGVPNAYGSYEEMLARPDIDAVYIATTNNFHYENILECLRWGKHVLCEKSMVPTAAQAREVFALARDKGLFVMECMWVRFLPKLRKVRQWVEEGRIGRVKLAQGNLGFSAACDPESRLYSPALGGGALYDVGVYVIEVLGWFASQPLTDVQAQVVRAPTGVDESVSFTLRYGDYLVGGQCSIAASLPENAAIYGEEGHIVLRERLHFGHRVELYDRAGRLAEAFTQEDVNGFIYQIEEAARCIEAGLLESETAPHSMTLECCRVFEGVLGR